MSIFYMIYHELKSRIEHLPEFNTDIAKKSFDSLDREWVSDIILDNGVFWFEYPAYGGFDDDVYDWLVNYIEGKGYKFLYNQLKARSL